MDIEEKTKQIDALKAEIEALGKLPDEILQRINYKFRLDWNYYSNQMEGGTLSPAETRSVMVGNIEVGGKPLKDIFEMKGHDNAVLEVMKMGKGEINISEKRIRELHTLIMYEEDPQKKQKIGLWKTEDNEIINYRNEKIHFTPAAKVKDAIHSLLNWLNAELDKIKARKKDAMHPALLAFEFHLRYLTIHPFYDGNGRTARILMNMILIRMGYPPVIIKTEKKKIYYQYLADVQAYGGDTDLYYGFMLDLLQESLLLVKNAIDGKNIEEEDDLDKKLELLKNRLQIQEEVKLKKADTIVVNLIKTLLIDNNSFYQVLLKVFEKFTFLFNEANIYAKINGISHKLLANNILLREKLLERDFRVTDVEMNLELQGFKKAGVNTFSVYSRIHFVFNDFIYIIYAENIKECEIKKLYHQVPSPDEMKDFAKMVGNYIYERIEKEIN